MLYFPDISKYANSQNKVAAADFESNHPFHIRVEDISRRLYAPVKNGSFSSTKWYYERVRGQFADQRSNEAKPKLKQFDFTKKIIFGLFSKKFHKWNSFI